MLTYFQIRLSLVDKEPNRDVSSGQGLLASLRAAIQPKPVMISDEKERNAVLASCADMGWAVGVR